MAWGQNEIECGPNLARNRHYGRSNLAAQPAPNMATLTPLVIQQSIDSISPVQPSAERGPSLPASPRGSRSPEATLTRSPGGSNVEAAVGPERIRSGVPMSQASEVSASEAAFISLRIVTFDHYMAQPIPGLDPLYAQTRHESVHRVPILRLFGPTPGGQKACLHLHGVFPYLYVPVPARGSSQGYAYRLGASLDRALNLSLGLSTSQPSHIYRIQAVSGVPFYGYHPRSHDFLKLFFYNPRLVQRAADLLQNGAILGLKIQPHESHVPYGLQFMMDYNLQGMNFIHLAQVQFRGPRPESGRGLSPSPLASAWDVSQRPAASQRMFDLAALPEALWLPDTVARMASSELEVDGVAADILNTNASPSLTSAADRKSLNPGLEAIWDDERLRRQLLELEAELTPPASPPRPAARDSDSHTFWADRLKAQLARTRSEQPELGPPEPGAASPGGDPDATAQFQPPDGPGQWPIYAQESQADETASPLPRATRVTPHVPSLSVSLLERSSSRSSTQPRSRLSSPLSDDLFDEDPEATIIDEAVIHGGQSSSFDPDEQDLTMLSCCMCDCVAYAALLVFLAKPLYNIAIYLYLVLLGKPLDVTQLGEWALVTGSTDGIGKAYAIALAKKGLNIILVSRTPYKLQNVAAELESTYKVKTKIIDIDFTTSESDYLPKLTNEIKDMEIGILVNNVGLSYDHPDEFLKIDDGEQKVRDLVNVNITSMNSITRLILPQMVERKKGAVINLSSLSAIIPAPLLSVYGGVKAYVDRFSQGLAMEYAPYGITIQCVLPGYVVSNMSGLKKASFIAPTAEVFVRSALGRLGVFAWTNGFWVHDVMAAFISLIPEPLANSLIFGQIEAVRKRAYRKKAKKE
eukprot:maker-scaffold83_size396513-snap-gene-1.20 protein:Tk00962 transcript:maker-scaffold83_size396513-snap-gene-1.20-mRNA-1 annotation:"hypothetical protein DAPPUDRAFT_301034"